MGDSWERGDGATAQLLAAQSAMASMYGATILADSKKGE